MVLFLTHYVFLHRPRTESWWNKWRPSLKEKSLTGQEAPCFCPNNRSASGSRHRSDRLHCFNTVKVSLLCFLITIDSDHFLTGNSQRPWCRPGSVIESKRSFSSCQHILNFFQATFFTGWMWLWLKDWAPTFTNSRPEQNASHANVGSILLSWCIHFIFFPKWCHLVYLFKCISYLFLFHYNEVEGYSTCWGFLL